MRADFYDRIFNLVSMIGIAMLMIPLFLIFLISTLPHSVPLLSLAAVLSTALGYGLQWLFGALTGKKASSDGLDREGGGMMTGFRVGYAAVPILLSLLVAIAVFFLSLRYWSGLGNVLPDGRVFYFTYLYPILAAVLVFAAECAGCVIWFYPIERLSNIYLLIAGCVLFFLESVALAVSSTAAASDGASPIRANLGIPFAVFFVCVLVIYSQSNLQKKYRGSVVSVITGKERRFSLLLACVLLLLFLVAVGIAYILVSGVTLLFRTLLFILMYRVFRSGSSDPSSVEYEYVDPEEAGQMFRREVMSPENQYMLASFFLLILGVVILIVLIRTGLWKKFLRWLREVLDTVLIGIGIFRVSFDPNKDDEDESENYKDEVKRIQNAEVRDFRAMAESTDSYRLFLTRLSRLKTYDEQLCFAYAVLLKMYRKMNVALKTSDTPREVKGKVTRALAEKDIEEITRDFERVRYAEEDPGSTESADILNRICSTVKRYMY